jgi:hypothetical protein
MEPTNDKPVRTRRSHAEVLNLLTEFEKANVSVKEFCNTHRISRAAFYKWQSRDKSKKQGRKPTGFAALQITSSSSSADALLFAEVKGPDSYRVKIYQPVSAAYLKELLP